MKKTVGKPYQSVSRSYAASLVLLLLVVTALAANRHFSHLEQRLFFAAYNLPLSWKPFFLVVTQLGSGWAAVVMSGLVYIKQGIGTAIRLLLATGVASVIVEILKHLVTRPRPYQVLQGVVRRDPLTVGGYGFPSGHATISFLLAYFLATRLAPRYRILPFIVALIVCISRLYLGMHAPLDVLAGMTIGSLVGALFFGKISLAKASIKA